MTQLGLMPAQAEMDVGALYRRDPTAAASNLQQYAQLLGPYTVIHSGAGGVQAPYQAGPNPWTAAVQGGATGIGLYNMWRQHQNQGAADGGGWGGSTPLGSSGVSGGGYLSQGSGGGGPFLS